ncbi:hypothetical protein AUC43_16520 [Hymenobacter sedentarius]|uniref:Uncharacterized protein n=1 Tax=Hymenobacter sedentarius TaxID=1411621 RepID=A0A0U4ASW0_9BACT|nr:hypothetical protein [Hymenobacter sedentarius]ALW86544.1 hypothetical protein AUC43_16520 [Hymenobacter sedentarius]
MKLYSYVLYKVFRFRMATEIKALGARVTQRAVDTAGLMLLPFMGWSLYGLIIAMHFLTNAGIIYNRQSQQLWFMGILGTEWLVTYWLNYRILKSAHWILYRSEFAGHSPAKRHLGSIMVLLLLISFSLLPFYLIQNSSYR